MRKIFLDENLPPLLTAPLNATYRQHRFRSHHDEQLAAYPDLELFPELAERDFNLIITNDRAQLGNPEERRALAKAKLHWVGLPAIDATGTALIAQQLAIVVAAVGRILDNWPKEPTAHVPKSPGLDVFAVVEPL